MTQVWLHTAGTGSTHGEMAVRADYISALYEIRDTHTRRGVGRPWRIEAAVVGLPHPVVLVTAADPEDEDGSAFEAALPDLRDEISEELSRVQPGVDVSHGWIRDFALGKPTVIDWERSPDPPREPRLRGI